MISLKDFLSFDFADDVRPIYPLTAPEKIPIQSISILEPPVEEFVREGEIIISTALSVRDTPKLLFEFIQDIFDSHAAALILAFPNDSFLQLDAVKEHFHDQNVPLLTIPWSHLFSDLVEHTLKEIWDGEKKTQNHLESLQKELLNSYLAGKTLNDAAEIIYKYLGVDIFILDTNQKIKGTNLRCPAQNGTFLPSSGENDRMRINAKDRLYGQLLFRSGSVLSQIEPQILEQCIITPLTLWFDREWSLTASKMKSRKDFVWKLAHNNCSSPQEIFSKGELLGFRTDCSYLCLAGTATARTSIQNGRFYPESDSSILVQSVSSIIQEQVLSAAAGLGLAVMTTLREKKLIIYLEKPSETASSDLVNRYLDVLENQLYQALPNLVFIWGFDNQALPMDRLGSSYRNAKAALQISLSAFCGSLRNCYQLSIRQKILFTLCNDREAVELAEHALEHILAYDRKKNGELIDTLECFCQTNYNLSETARLMHLHRQSLLYRMNKIEALSSLSLKNHDDLFVLEICIMIYKKAGPNG